MTESNNGIPDELLDKLENFHDTITEMTEILSPLQTLNFNSTDYQLSPLDRARLNLASGYALNSLFWMYLNTLGIDPKKHKIKSELERYGGFMAQIKELSDKDKAPVLNKGAAKRFVRNALWEPKEKDIDDAASSSVESSEENVVVKRESDFPDQIKRKKRRH